MLELVLLGAVLLWLLLKLWNVPYRYWELRGFPYIPGKFPFGSSMELVIRSKYQGYTIQEQYKAMEGHPFFGIYTVRKPALVLRDPEMIGIVMAKEFAHFRDRLDFRRSQDEFLSQHLFNLEGERWRTLRIKMSPTFTSGKLKAMFPLFVNCAEELEKRLLSKSGEEVDIKDICSSFTSDTICTCAFGLETHSQSGINSEMKNLGIDVFRNRVLNIIKLAILNLFPPIKKFYVPRFLPNYMGKFLLGIIRDTVDHRRSEGLKRNDFLELLIQMNDKGTVENDIKSEDEKNYGSPVDMTYEMMTAQCFVFFLAGFETSSSIQSYCLYQLALNPEIQNKVFKEIEEAIEVHGDITYQAVLQMTYLDMVVHETLRMYPTGAILTRNCTKDFTFPSGHRVEKGTEILIPTYALHHDPAYFNNPEVFNPERFSIENKQFIVPYSYLAFGEGPRICIGIRFGLLQTKIGLITILRRYQVEKTDSTPNPLKFKGTLLVTTAKGPIRLKLASRENSKER